jgi:hypothetical protein
MALFGDGELYVSLTDSSHSMELLVHNDLMGVVV